MGRTYTQFISYHEIDVKRIDLFDDAWGFNGEFHDVINLLRQIKTAPKRALTRRLINRIRNLD